MANLVVTKEVLGVPVGRVAMVKAIVDAQESALAELLPKGMDARRFRHQVMMAFAKEPELLKCDGESILGSVMKAGSLGLDVSGVTGEGYLIPFWNKDKRRNDCQFIPGYKGLARLARQSGVVKRIEADVVYEADDFTFAKGSDPFLRFVPAFQDDRGERRGAYALAELSDGMIQFELLTAKEVLKVKSFSKAKYGPWVGEFEDEMWKKTAFLRLSKWLALSADDPFRIALEIEKESFDFETRREKPSEASSVNARLGLSNGSGEEEIATESEREGAETGDVQKDEWEEFV